MIVIQGGVIFGRSSYFSCVKLKIPTTASAEKMTTMSVGRLMDSSVSVMGVLIDNGDCGAVDEIILAGNHNLVARREPFRDDELSADLGRNEDVAERCPAVCDSEHLGVLHASDERFAGNCQRRRSGLRYDGNP